jgi:hypothetical protein
MLKLDIEILQEKAMAFLAHLDAKAQALGMTLVSLEAGQMVFMDNESGVQVKAQLVVGNDALEGTVEPVKSVAEIGTPGIKLG